jgi:hypothetical protein
MTTKQIPSALPSDRKFGFFFSLVFVGFAVYARRAALPLAVIGLGAIAVAFAVLAQVNPRKLHALNRIWFELGILIGRVVSPIVLGLIFFTLITPVSVIMRLFGRDALRIKHRQASTYWLKRDPLGPAPDSFKNQF